MRTKRNFYIGILLGILISAVIALLYLPFIKSNGSFTRGFLACLLAFSFAHVAIFIRNPQRSFFRSRQDGTVQPGPASRASSFPRTFFAIGVLVLGLVSCFFLFMTNERIKEFVLEQKQQASRQAELIESMRKSGLGQLMGHVLDKMDEELNNSPSRTLTDETIARIADLSYSLKPYAYSKGDSITRKLLSPERGQLLLVLSRANIDSISFKKIIAEVTFIGADLREADLKGMNLSGMDLSEADLMDADLQAANLSGTNLSFANLWGAKLNKANMQGVVMKRADLRWAELNEADLRAADLHEADLTSAQLRKADLRSASLKWTDFSGAFLNEADLNQADLYRSVMKRTQFVKTNLSEANMVLANLSEANMSEANMTNAMLNELIVVEKDWLHMLEEWKVTGREGIQKIYKIVDGANELTYYQLKKVED